MKGVRKPPPSLATPSISLFPSEEEIAFGILVNSLLFILRHMCRDDIDALFQVIPQPSQVQYRVLGHYAGRLIVFVEDVIVDGIRLRIGSSFFRSTGTSRGDSSISGSWFPCTGIIKNPFSDKITKLEDRYILDLEDPGISDSAKQNIINEIGDNGRFITRKNAIASKALSSISSILDSVDSSFELDLGEHSINISVSLGCDYPSLDSCPSISSSC